jgi:hypothetical protein
VRSAIWGSLGGVEVRCVQDFVDKLSEMSGAAQPGFPPGTIATRRALAVLAGVVLAFVYRRTYTGVVFLSPVAHTQVLLAVGGALIWLVVGDNIVRAFGLAGMIGLIRYRTRIADPKDTTILLFSMIIGMACGLGQFLVAGIGTAFVIVALVWLKVTHRPEKFFRPESGLTDLLGAEVGDTRGEDD